MSEDQKQLESAIQALEMQRSLLGDAVVDTALSLLRSKLEAVNAVPPPAPATPPDQTLKLATVLFLDVVDSTALSRRLDPEDIHALFDGALARYRGIVEAHGGRVLQFAGDSLLAVFGADTANEDDPERAVRAGLALLAESRQMVDEVTMQHGILGLQIRLGIHTGHVLLGGGVDAEGTVRGIAVNIAARMEQSAPAGGLRISHDTYRHVRGVFDVEVQPPIQVKGLNEPVVSYLVQRAKPRAFRLSTRGIEGVETRMVGRDTEFEQLQQAFLRLYADRRLAVISIVAEAGIGKSRLLYEFEDWSEARPERFVIFKGRANPHTKDQPYGLLRDILAWRFQISDSDSMDAARLKLESGIAPLFMADDGEDIAQGHAHLLGHLIGLDFSESKHIKGIRDDARQIRNRGFHAAAQMFRRVAAKEDAPVMMLLDDLHWADDASLDFVSYLGEVNRDVPMLAVGLTRPTLFERRPDWSSSTDLNQRIDLRPLDKSSSRLLANELLKKLPEIPAALRELITGGAEGNPFYMEELVKMLVDEGAIAISTERWSVHPEKLLATRVPTTLTGVLQARLDGLPARERLTLQQASVIGLIFWDEALAALDAQAPETLPALAQRELVLAQQAASLDDMREYVFRHQILHQVTYETLLRRNRRELHARAAAWLAGLTGARASDFLGATAEHYLQAGDTASACEYFARAAEHAKARYAQEAALGYVAQALAILNQSPTQDDPLLRWRLLNIRERTLDLAGKRIEQRADIDALLQLADAMDDDRRRAEAAWRRSDIAMRTGDFRTQECAARKALELAERVNDAALRLRAQHRLAGALNMLGQFVTGKALAQSGLVDARSLGLRHIEALFLNALSIVAGIQDDQMANLEADQQTLIIDRDLGNRRAEAVTLGNLGLSWLNLGQHAHAHQCLDEGLRLIRAMGNRASEPYLLNNLSLLALHEGNDAQALAHARVALDIAVAVQDPQSEVLSLCSLGTAELALGRHASASEAFERAYTVALDINNPRHFDAAAGLARVRMAQGDLAGALVAMESVLTDLGNGGSLEGAEAPRLIRLTCYQVLQRAADPRAAAMLAEAHENLPSKAATISDPELRHGFLNNIPEHRQILAAWSAGR